jgi:hypothetical protein
VFSQVIHACQGGTLPKSLRRIVAGLFAVCALAGCASGSASEQASATTSPSSAAPATESITSSAPVPVTTPSASPTATGPGLHGTVSLQDASGYRWDLSYDYTLVAPTISIANDPPGRATVIMAHRGSLTATFNNPGRNQPSGLDPFILDFGGLYAMSSPVCQLPLGPLGSRNAVVVHVTAPQAGDYCYMTLATHGDDLELLRMQTGDPTATMAIRAMAEADAPQMAEAVMQPAMLVIKGTNATGHDSCVFAVGTMNGVIEASSVGPVTCRRD